MKDKLNQAVFKSVLKGVVAAVALLVFYFLVLALVSGWDFTLIQFFQNWYWVLGLSFGFGIQIALFTYLRSLRNSVSRGTVIASGTTSGLAMIACCSHYLVNIVPIIGVAGLTTIIGQYQREFFLVGVIFNLAGIGYLASRLVKFQKEKNGK